MNGKYLLDSNIVIALFANDDLVAKAIGQAHELYICSIVAGELYYGAMNSTKVDQNISRIEAFLDCTQLLDCDLATSKLFGTLKASLRTKGKPIPDNDIWIAATAVQHSLTLVSRDDDFSVIENLAVERW